MPLWLALEAGSLRADVVAHRRWGKDDVALHWTALCAVTGRVGTYWHMLPEASQARKAIWEAINPHTGLRRIDEAFPPVTREVTREAEMFIRFRSGSTWQVVGSDNFNSLVGSPPIGIVFSEWALAKPDAWAYLRPILAENGGWSLFLWTPRGRGHATRAFEARERDPANWYTLRSPATQTDVFTPAQLERERAELISELGSTEEGEARYSQEYEVDFDAAVPGSYYGALIAAAQAEGRIGCFPYDPALPVMTAWDIGVDDYTAVWFLQQQGQQVRAIDYAEASGDGAEQIVRAYLPELIPEPQDPAAAVTARQARADALAALGRAVPYKYGIHHLPHDVMVREWGAGAKTRYQTLVGLGVRPLKVGVAQDPVERINATRRLLPAISFDAERCMAGVDRLRNYRKRWNATTRTYTGPLHDENSHGADAFGEFAVNCSIVPAKPAAPPTVPPDRARWGPQKVANSWKTR